MTRTWDQLWLGAALTVVAAVPARAEIVVERYFPAGFLPPGVEDVYLPVQPSSFYNFGQSFTLGTTGQLRQLDVIMARWFPGPANLQPFHMTLTAGIGGPVLADKDFTVPDSLTQMTAWVPIDLVADSIVLPAGSSLFLSLSSNTALDPGIIWFGISGAEELLYQGGAGYQRVPCSSPESVECGAWTPVSYGGNPVDFSYRAYIDTSVALPGVPEPGNWALLIAGFSLTGAALRRRRAVQPA